MADEEGMAQLPLKPEIDRAHYVPGAILWSVDRDQVTIRNVNSVRKIREPMEEMEG